jgi:hypothetical protein
MGAVEDRLDLSVTGKTELQVVKEYLRIDDATTEGTAVDAEGVGVGDAIQAAWSLDNTNVLEDTLRVYVADLLQVEGSANDYTVNLTTGVVTFEAGSIPALNEIITASYRHGTTAGGAEDTIVNALLDTAKRAMDDFLNNPFEELIPTIVFSSVVAEQGVTIDGQTYTCKPIGGADPEWRQFEVGATDNDTANNFVALVNSDILSARYGPRGVQGCTATNANGTVTLAKRYPRAQDFEVTSSWETLLVTYVRTNRALPEVLTPACLRIIARLYERRIDGVKLETTSGEGSVHWDKLDDVIVLLAPHRKLAAMMGRG